MFTSLILLAQVVSAPEPAQAPIPPAEIPKAQVEKSSLATAKAKLNFEGRKEASIAFSRDIDSFRVETEDGEDILYLDTGFGHWYRAPMNCTGIGSPENAFYIAPLSRGYPIDKFTRFRLSEIGAANTNECFISSLIELSPEETVVLGLEKQKMVDARAARAAKNKK